MSPRLVVSGGAVIFAWLLGATGLPGQDRARIDPYCKGKDEAMRAAGYTSFGPFAFGDDHTSEDIDDLLGDGNLIWIETEHFRLGCAAAPVELKALPTATRRSLLAELKRLQRRLQRLDHRRVKVLDRWLRAHLFAQRLEELYERFLLDIGHRDADFAGLPVDLDRLEPAYLGEGPYLGMREKFSVLIVHRHADMARYTKMCVGVEWSDSLRLTFTRHGGLGACLSETGDDGIQFDDTALHAHLTYNIAVNLVQGYRTHGHELPAWLTHGIAHWYSRHVSPSHPIFERHLGTHADDRRGRFTSWGEYASRLIRRGALDPLEPLLQRTDPTRFGLDQHVASWFFVDYLMYARKEQFMRFFHLMKAPLPGRDSATLLDQVLDRQQICFAETFGCTVATLEAEWHKRSHRLGHRR